LYARIDVIWILKRRPVFNTLAFLYRVLNSIMWKQEIRVNRSCYYYMDFQIAGYLGGNRFHASRYIIGTFDISIK